MSQQQGLADVQYEGKVFRYAMFAEGVWRYFDRDRGKLLAFRHQELVCAVRWHNGSSQGQITTQTRQLS
jgi:hypothetical protein